MTMAKVRLVSIAQRTIHRSVRSEGAMTFTFSIALLVLATSVGQTNARAPGAQRLLQAVLAVVPEMAQRYALAVIPLAATVCEGMKQLVSTFVLKGLSSK